METKMEPPSVCAVPVPLDDLFGDKVAAFSEEERDWIARAYSLAEERHRGVTRMSGSPFISHPVEVANILLELGLDWVAICAGLLHDTVEDTTVTYNEIKEGFPDPIADLVAGVTKISSLSSRSSHEEQVENLRKMVLAMAQDIRVILIKLADRLHNMRTLKHLPLRKQKRISRSTLEIYAPLAHRLGIYRIKSELEDLSMRYIYPDAYRDLRERIQGKKRDREKHIQESILFLKKELEKNGIEAEVTGRSKHFWSIYNKMRNQNLSFEEIYDLNALRVICNSRNTCYEILGVIHSIWKPVPEQFSDYIALPKSNMYQSIHTKVFGLSGQLCEIQVRTWEMHRTAEMGIAAHYLYKEGGKNVSKTEERLAWLRQTVEWLTDTNEPSELLLDLKQDVFNDTVFIFTPKGDVIEMNRGATILDFAYRIHTDLGHRCVGGTINGRFAPLRTELNMGDVVEIRTSKTPHPSADWLKIATSSRGRAKIRHALKEKDYDKNVTLGKEMLQKHLSERNLKFSQSELHEKLKQTLDIYHVRTLEDLFSEIGFGTVLATSVVSRLAPEQKPPKKKRHKKGRKLSSSQMVLVDGMPGSMTRFGQCCQPQPGDDITGYVTLGRGISIHQVECSYLRRLLAQSPEKASRIVPVEWNEEAAAAVRVGIQVVGLDRQGILRDVSAAIASQNIMILESSGRSNRLHSQAVLRFQLIMANRSQLQSLIYRLKEIPGVQTVQESSRPRR